MVFKSTVLLLAFLSVSSYAQNITPVLDSFKGDQKNSEVTFSLADKVTLPEDEFNRRLAEKHYELFTEAEVDGVPVYLNLTTHRVLLETFDGKYKISFSVMFYDKQGNVLDSFSEAYFDGTIIKEESAFKASIMRTYSFKDGDVKVLIDSRGVYTLNINYGEKPLYGVFSDIKFILNN